MVVSSGGADSRSDQNSMKTRVNKKSFKSRFKRQRQKRRLYLISLNSFFTGSDVPIKVDRTFYGALEQFLANALPAVTNDSYRYQHELNPGVLDAGLWP